MSSFIINTYQEKNNKYIIPLLWLSEKTIPFSAGVGGGDDDEGTLLGNFGLLYPALNSGLIALCLWYPFTNEGVNNTILKENKYGVKI